MTTTRVTANLGAPPRLLTADEVAETLGLTTATVYRLCREGAIPCVRLGNGRQAPLRIDEQELEGWIYGTETR